ncbi:MAG TPA: hypothetical protein VE262_11265 [Blastocatellia bacterium]|nr:hypothetical protein [Blastocatellia bacterium]
MSNSANTPGSTGSTGGNISIAPVTTDSCRPFTLDVMVFSPEAGYKFEVSIERDCIKATATDPAIEQWKLVFDLYKLKTGGTDFDQIVHVSYTAANPVQERKVAATAANGLNPAQSQQLITKVHPAVKGVEDLGSLPPDQADVAKQKIKDQMSKTVDLAF